jgi:hypothetical protein
MILFVQSCPNGIDAIRPNIAKMLGNDMVGFGWLSPTELQTNNLSFIKNCDEKYLKVCKDGVQLAWIG